MIDERLKVNPMVKSQMFVTTTDMAQRRRYDKVSVKKETNLEIALEMAVACEAVQYSTTCGWRILFIGITNEKN